MGFKHLNIDLLSSKWKPGEWSTLLDYVDNVFFKVPALVGRCLTSAARGHQAPVAQGSLEASPVPNLAGVRPQPLAAPGAPASKRGAGCS